MHFGIKNISLTYTLDEAIDLIHELNVPKGYLTHISHQLGKYADVNSALPEGIELAYDGMQLFFD